jgi:hypothetical protein
MNERRQSGLAQSVSPGLQEAVQSTHEGHRRAQVYGDDSARVPDSGTQAFGIGSIKGAGAFPRFDLRKLDPWIELGLMVDLLD